jgi:hypothetical protein
MEKNPWKRIHGKNPWKESRERIHERIPRKVWYTYLIRGGYRVWLRAAGGRKE